MINIKSLLESERVVVNYIDSNVDKDFVKTFRKDFNLTQVALANILGVTKKAIEKWEQGANKVNKSSAVLLRLLKNNPELMEQVYSVKYGVKGKLDEEYKLVDTKIATTKTGVDICECPSFTLRPCPNY